MKNFQDKAGFIWSIAELLRGPYRPEDYGEVILPMSVLRRFDAVLSDTKEAVLNENKKHETLDESTKDQILNRVAKQKFNNTSQFDFVKLLSDPDNISDNLRDYINGFSSEARQILSHFNFDNEIDKMEENNLLYFVVRRFSEIDLHPEEVSNIEMGYIFEKLIRRFSLHTQAGDHYTPREVIKLMVHLMFFNDDDILLPSLTRTLYDSCAGTGGMWTVADEYIKEYNPTGHLEFFAQEINGESYAISKANMLIKGQDASNIRLGNTLSNDQFKGSKFDYMITNPPFAVEWKTVKDTVKAEHKDLGFKGRFGAGLPRIADGQLLFLQNLVAKMKPVTEEEPNGSRMAIIMNSSPLFTGDAGSGESEIRRYLFENDLVEGVVALPNQLFYNTGISTYIWILTNNKPSYKQGKVQLVNAVDKYEKMRKNLGNKRHKITKEQINEIVKIYGQTNESDDVKIFNNEDFGYHRITIERPLRLNFQINEERLARLDDESAFTNLTTSRKQGEKKIEEIAAGKDQQETIKSVLTNMQNERVYKNREEFIGILKKSFEKKNIILDNRLLKSIWRALSEVDETAEICRMRNNKIEPDRNLREIEYVPLSEDISTYFKKEILFYYPDAWIDKNHTLKGYQVLFPQIFYAKNDKIQSKLKNQDTRRLKDISMILSGVNINRKRIQETGKYLLIKPNNFRKGYIEEDYNSDYINEILDPNELELVLQKNDIIINLVGEPLIYHVTGEERPLIASYSVAIIRSEENEYIKTYLSTKGGLDLFKLQTEKKSTRSVIKRLNINDLKLIRIPILPIEDLNKASDKYIKNSNNKADLEVLKQELQIQKEVNYQLEQSNKQFMGFLNDRFNAVDEKLNEMNTKIDEVLDQLKIMQTEFQTIKSLKIEEEQMIKLLEQKLDETLNVFSEETFNLYIEIVKTWIDPNWHKLEPLSQKFLPSAEMLYTELNKIENNDPSPFIIQYCRSLENELLEKIFRPYLKDLHNRNININKEFCEDLETNEKGNPRNKNRDSYSFAKQLIKLQDKNEEEWFFELGRMTFILTKLTGSNADRSPLLNDFKQFILKSFNENFINRQYYDEIRDLTKDFRNKAAHPNIINKKEAELGRNKIKEVLKLFTKYYK